jgi:hypothetical protein
MLEALANSEPLTKLHQAIAISLGLIEDATLIFC